MHRPRAGDPGAGAADLLLQLASWRVRALHRPGVADGDRPDHGRAGSVAVAGGGCDRAVGQQRLQLLRADHRGDRREVRRRHGDAVGPALGRASGSLPDRHQRRPCRGLLSQPLRAAAVVLHALRGDHLQPRAALSRDGLRGRPREDRGVHVARAVPGVQGRAPAAGVAGGAGRRDRDPRVLRDVGAARAGLAGRGRADRDRAPHRAADLPRDPGAVDVPGERRDRLPVDGARGGDAERRRGAADPPGDADRLGAGGRVVRVGRAVDRAASARQHQVDRDAGAAARSGQHGAGRRARRADDARGRPSDRHRAGRRRARRPDRRPGHGQAGHEGQVVADGAVPGGDADDRGAGQASRAERATSRSGARRSTTSRRSTSRCRSAS